MTNEQAKAIRARDEARAAYVKLTNSASPTDSGGAVYTATQEMMAAFDAYFDAPIAAGVVTYAEWADAVRSAEDSAKYVYAEACDHTKQAIDYVCAVMLAAAPAPVAAPAHPVAGAAVADEYAWLVERGPASAPMYRTFEQGMPAWTLDHNKAIRYSRREDAEMAHAEDSEAERIAQHGWMSIAAPASPAVATEEVSVMDQALARAKVLSTISMEFAANLCRLAQTTIKGVDYLRRDSVMNEVVAWRYDYDNAPRIDMQAVRAIKSKPVATDAPIIPEAGAEAAHDVLAERQRQKQVEGWTPEHDDQYQGDELSLAAACYAMASDVARLLETPNLWPWPENWWKPTTERRNLVKAGALILAEIERLDRAALKGGQSK